MRWRGGGISGAELKQREPNLNREFKFAVSNPSSGCVCPYGLTIAYAENAVQNGAQVSLNTAVLSMEVEGGEIKSVSTNRGTVYPALVINAAGVFAEDVARMAGDRFFSIYPRRGTNSILDKKAGARFSSIASVMKPARSRGHSKGGGIVHTAHGNLLVGPDAVETFEKENVETRPQSIDAVFAKHEKTMPTLNRGDIITYFTGVRAPTFEKDFIIEKGWKTGNIIHCAGIQSPGLTTAPAVALTTIRDTVLCLDRENRPLRDIILWLDKRQAEFDDPFPLHKKLMFKAAGMEGAARNIYRASACNWIRQHQPEVWAKTAKYVMLPTYLNYKITGVLADCSANMIGHMPFDYKNRRWQQPSALTHCIYDIPLEKLCDLTRSGQVIGTVTREFSAASGVPEGLPLIATGSDKGCETLGLSVIQPHKAAISLGTTATIQLALERYVEPQPFMPAYPAVPNHLYNPEIELYRGFWLVSWFLKEFCAKDLAQAEAMGCPPEELLDQIHRGHTAGVRGPSPPALLDAGDHHPCRPGGPWWASPTTTPATTCTGPFWRASASSSTTLRASSPATTTPSAVWSMRGTCSAPTRTGTKSMRSCTSASMPGCTPGWSRCTAGFLK